MKHQCPQCGCQFAEAVLSDRPSDARTAAPYRTDEPALVESAFLRQLRDVLCPPAGCSEPMTEEQANGVNEINHRLAFLNVHGEPTPAKSPDGKDAWFFHRIAWLKQEHTDPDVALEIEAIGSLAFRAMQGSTALASAVTDREQALERALQLVLDDWANANAIGDDAREQAERAINMASEVAPTVPYRCPYCTSDNEAIRSTYYDQTCEGCVKRMGQ